MYSAIAIAKPVLNDIIDKKIIVDLYKRNNSLALIYNYYRSNPIFTVLDTIIRMILLI